MSSTSNFSKFEILHISNMIFENKNSQNLISYRYKLGKSKFSAINFLFFPNLFRRKGTCLYFHFRRSRKCHRPKYSLNIGKTIKIVNYHLSVLSDHVPKYPALRFSELKKKSFFHILKLRFLCENIIFLIRVFSDARIYF